MAYEIDFMGLRLKNAVVVAAGPWASDGASIQKCIDAGAAAVITETILMEESSYYGPRMYYRDGEMLSLSLYGHKSIEEWEAEVERVHKKDSVLICSIRGASPSEIAYIAKRTERLGADALQLDIFAPMDATIEQINLQPGKLYDLTRAVVESVGVPVMVRLPYNMSATSAYIRELERAGVSAISAIESLRGLSGVDLERRRALMPTFGGYTGRHIRPVSLAATATLSQLTNCQICGVGGVENHLNILEFIMLGAVTAQLGSVIMRDGYGVIGEAARELEAWMRAHGCESYGEIRGAALSSLQPYEQLPAVRHQSRLAAPCGDAACLRCVKGCMYGALAFEDGAVQNHPSRCTGCGFCVARCPKGLLSLTAAE